MESFKQYGLLFSLGTKATDELTTILFRLFIVVETETQWPEESDKLSSLYRTVY